MEEAVGVPAGRELPRDAVLRAPPVLRRARRGPLHLRRRRQPLPRLHAQRDDAHPRPRAPGHHRRRAGAGRERRVVQRPDRLPGRAGEADLRPRAVHRPGALHQLGHRGHALRHQGRAGLHRPAQDREVRGRIPRHPRVRVGQLQPVRWKSSTPSGPTAIPEFPATPPAIMEDVVVLPYNDLARHGAAAARQRRRPGVRHHGAGRVVVRIPAGRPGLPARRPRGDGRSWASFSCTTRCRACGSRPAARRSWSASRPT